MNPMRSSPRPGITLGQIARRILAYGKITRTDEKFLFRAMATETSLSSEDVNLINRVFDRLRMGLIRVTD